MTEIPIVDFSCVGIGKEEISKQPQEHVQRLSQEIHDAFTTIGFVYIKNHGIPEEQISNLFQVGKQFFQLPADVKSDSARPASGTSQGWDGCGTETLSPKRPGDFKEAFNIEDPYNDALPWPIYTDSVTFKYTVGNFFQICEELSFRILDLISIGLKLEDKTFIRRMHGNMVSGEHNKTTLRLLYYPALDQPLQEDQVRCGEHSDYGTITLLFQDSVGGLEVFHKNGEFVPARPIEGTILVNIGDLLQRWTNDKLVSTRHRVGAPTHDSSRSVARQSVAFFVRPIDEALIECLDGSGKYPPINALDYLNERFAATYI